MLRRLVLGLPLAVTVLTVAFIGFGGSWRAWAAPEAGASARLLQSTSASTSGPGEGTEPVIQPQSTITVPDPMSRTRLLVSSDQIAVMAMDANNPGSLVTSIFDPGNLTPPSYPITQTSTTTQASGVSTANNSDGDWGGEVSGDTAMLTDNLNYQVVVPTYTSNCLNLLIQPVNPDLFVYNYSGGSQNSCIQEESAPLVARAKARML